MRVIEYLQAKYGVAVPTAMLAREARAFGIPYPLRSGWLMRHGNTEITPEIAARLADALGRSNGSRPASAQAGLNVLHGVPSG